MYVGRNENRTNRLAYIFIKGVITQKKYFAQSKLKSNVIQRKLITREFDTTRLT